ncbi:MAG: glycosyltransferase family 2 protein [Paracoccaceae bacterium]|jgi:hypothetical protein|nr:glycosyltransferase family 2 protein [Paracoccaceae bacterium]MDP7185755.1 glycosyltransferase family 2 protein [Paracoccaceae bacterium]
MTQTKGRVLVVLLNYKTAQMTAEAMHRTREAMRGVPGEIMVVDNDSQDGSFEFLSDAIAAIDPGDGLTKCHILQSDHNGGFGYGNNVGISWGLDHGGFDYFYIQNSDAFPSDSAISALHEFLDDHPHAGFAGSHLHGEDGEPHFTQFRFPSIASEFEGKAQLGPITRLLKRYQVPLFDLSKTEPTKIGWIAGASLMVRRQVFEDIGLFDENYFLYFEEVDLCRRAKLAGWDTYYVPTSRVVHLGSVSTGMLSWQRVPEYWLDSRLYYYSKNYGKLYATLATIAAISGGMIARLRMALGGRKVKDPDHFLRDLTRHFLRSIWTPTARSSETATPVKKPAEV